MNNYIIISLGSNCAVKYSIKEYDDTQFTYPFDWIITNDVNQIINVIETKTYDDFINFHKYLIDDVRFTNNSLPLNERSIFSHLDKNQLKQLIYDHHFGDQPLINLYEKLEKLIIQTISQLQIYIDDISRITKFFYDNLVCVLMDPDQRIILVHDHHISSYWEEVKNKYHRLFERFFSINNSSKMIIFVRYANNNENVYQLYDTLEKHFKNFYLLYMFHVPDDLEKAHTVQFEKVNDYCFIYRGYLIFDKKPFFRDIYTNFLHLIKKM
jgi:hypothetical protein